MSNNVLASSGVLMGAGALRFKNIYIFKRKEQWQQCIVDDGTANGTNTSAGFYGNSGISTMGVNWEF